MDGGWNYEHEEGDPRSWHTRTAAGIWISPGPTSDEVEPFEREVVGALVAALAPALGGDSGAASMEIAAADADAIGEPAGAQPTLHSEIVDGTRLWRLRLLQGAAGQAQAGDEWVVCKV